MRILYIYQFFSVGRTPDYLRPLRFSQVLAEKGHQVVVLSTDFNRFTSELERPKREWIPTKGMPIEVIRLSTTPKYRKNLAYRFLNYTQYAVKTFVKGLALGHFDVVITSLPPLFVGPTGWALSVIKKAPLFLEVQDLWPDALEVKGAVKGRMFLDPLYAMANFMYRKADYIGPVTHGIRDEIAKKGIDPAKMSVLPNGMDPELYAEFEDGRDKVRTARGWDNKFVASYIGVHTKVTAVDVIVEAAEILRNEPDIVFEIFGGGSTAPEIEALIHQKGLPNCHMRGTIPKNEVPAVLGASDACLMCLFETPLAHIYLQNKLFDYMGAGKPIIAAMKGHQREIIEEAGAGICVDPGDSKGLAEAVMTMSKNREQSRKMGLNGRSHAIQRYNIHDIFQEYADLVVSCA